MSQNTLPGDFVEPLEGVLFDEDCMVVEERCGVVDP